MGRRFCLTRSPEGGERRRLGVEKVVGGVGKRAVVDVDDLEGDGSVIAHRLCRGRSPWVTVSS